MDHAEPPAGTGLPAPAEDAGWNRLAPRARPLFILSATLGTGLPALAAMAATWLVLQPRTPWAGGIAAALLLVTGWSAWLANRRYLRTRWRLDGSGFGLRRGRLWYSETRVPASRVQHIDIRRGPIERALGLSTLLIHTAGTRNSAVSVSGLDSRDAEHLRDHLARQVENDDDAS